MQMTYDDMTGAVYVYFERTQAAKTKRISDHTLIDYDADGNVIGVELLYANEGVDLADLGDIPQLADVERLLEERGFRVLVQ
jgi:uncharacterized protein YuzE